MTGEGHIPYDLLWLLHELNAIKNQGNLRNYCTKQMLHPLNLEISFLKLLTIEFSKNWSSKDGYFAACEFESVSF